MAAIIPIPSTRISNAFVRERLLSQLQSDQIALFRAQNAISTGRRLTLPSDDAPAAARAISLQRIIERKTQVKSNLTTNQSYLSATDVALADVSSLLAQARSTALSVADTGASNIQRASAAQEINRIIEQLVDIGNQKFRGRYIFAGSSTTVQPFTQTSSGVLYHGDRKKLLSYSDIDLLFESNVPGDQTFGAISDPVRGDVDVNPVLTDDTRLSDLRGGEGIRSGSISISDGVHTSIVDISGAATIGDVARLLEQHPPPTRTVVAHVSLTGLSLEFDAAGGGNLIINEVGGGTTAAELGILKQLSGSTGPLIGDDLNPRLTVSTPLEDILGVRARGYLSSAGAKNNLILEAARPGADFNGVAIKYVDDSALQAGPGLTAGDEEVIYHETASEAQASLTLSGSNDDLILTAATAGTAFNNVVVDIVGQTGLGNSAVASFAAGHLTLTVDDAGGTSVAALISAINLEGTFTATGDTSLDGPTAGFVLAQDIRNNAANTQNTGSDAKTLEIRIQSGVTNANQVIAKINAEATFRARLDPSEKNNDGNGEVVDSFSDLEAVATTSGGSGSVFDKQSGLRVVNAGKEHVIRLDTAQTVEDLLNILNGAEAGLLAEINEAGTGINVKTRNSGLDFSIGENGGRTATELGIRSFTAGTRLSDLNHGDGVRAPDGPNFIIHRKDGVEYAVDLTRGVPAAARVNGAGGNDALLFSRSQPGSDGNAFSVTVADSGVGGGDAVSLAGNVLTFSVDLTAGFTAQEAIDLLAAHPTLGLDFSAQLDRATDPTNDGSGNLAASAGSVAFGGGKSAAFTVGDVLDLINNHPTNLASGVPAEAKLARFGNGIELSQNDPAGAGTLQIRATNFGQAAEDLGLVEVGKTSSALPQAATLAAATLTLPGPHNDLLFQATASGPQLNGTSIRFVDSGLGLGNETLTYDPASKSLLFDITAGPGGTTANAIAGLLAAHPVAGPLFTASLVPTDGSPNTGAGAVSDLSATATIDGGQAETITGADVNPLEVDGVFNALLRIRQALENNDIVAIQRSVDLLDQSATGVNFTRAELGARQQGLDVLQVRLDAEEVDLRGALSVDLDTDITAAISEFTSRQLAYEAALQTAAAASKLTLLDFL